MSDLQVIIHARVIVYNMFIHQVFKFSETVIMIFFFRRRGWGDNFIEIKIPVFIPESPLAVHICIVIMKHFLF